MAFIQRYLALGAFLFAGTSGVWAEADGMRIVSVAFNVFALQPPDDLSYYASPKAPLTALTFYPTARSREYHYSGGAEMKFYGATGGAPMALWRVPTEIHSALLVFSLNIGAAPGMPKYSVYAVDDGSTSVPAGHVAILNLTGREYRAQIAGHGFAVRTGINAAIPASGQIYVELLADVNGQTRVVGGHQFEAGPSERSIVLIFAPVKKTSIQPILRHLSSGSSTTAAAKHRRN